MKKKCGEMAMKEIVRLLIAVIVLVVLVGAAIFLLTGKGAEIIEAMRNAMRFGG